MKHTLLQRSLRILLAAVTLVMLCSCTAVQPAAETTDNIEALPADAAGEPAEAAVPTAEPTEAAEAAQEEPQIPIYEDELVRFFFTEYVADEGTIKFRVENKTSSDITILTPVEQTNDLESGKDSLLIDGVSYMSIMTSINMVDANSFCIYTISAVTGPDADGYLSLEPLDENAKSAELVQEFTITDANNTELAKIKLPVIDLASPSFFPLPSLMGFSTKTLSGEEIDSSYFSAHKLTMVNYWATWCGYCVDEMPDLSALHTEYADKGFAVLGVLVWDEGNEQSAQEFLATSGISYPVIAYDTVPALGDIADTQSGIPFTLFFDSQGNQVGDVVVGSRSKEEWAGMIDELLAQVG